MLKETLRRFPTVYRMAKKIKHAKTSLMQPHLEIATYKSSLELINRWVETLPSEFDAIIAVPRSGLYIGSIIAGKYGKPLSTLDGFLQGQVWYSKDATIHPIRSVLVVEDTVSSGKRLIPALARLTQSRPELSIKVAALFVNPKVKNLVDYYATLQKPPHITEWNLLTGLRCHGTVCCDLDGFLGKDCPRELDTDDEKYISWMQNCSPHLIPNYEVEAVITARLEKYRAVTEEWLNKHGVKFKNLIMLDLPRKAQRTFEAVTVFKAKQIRRFEPFIYLESNVDEAAEINRLSGIPVLCTDRLVMFQNRKAHANAALDESETKKVEYVEMTVAN